MSMRNCPQGMSQSSRVGAAALKHCFMLLGLILIIAAGFLLLPGDLLLVRREHVIHHLPHGKV